MVATVAVPPSPDRDRIVTDQGVEFARAAMSLLTLALLGGFDCQRGDASRVVLPTEKARALLAYLAVNAGRRHPRDRLATLLWGDRPDEQARANLRKTLSRLHGALSGRAPACLVQGRSDVGVRPGALVVDVARFETLAREGTPESLEQAAGLHRGPFLDGLGDCGESFHEWLMAERRRLDETLHDVLRRLLDHRVATGAVERAIQVALRLLALDPVDERVHRTLMRLYLQQDRPGAALEQYRQCRDVLGRELGIAPSAATEQVRSDVLCAAPEGAATPVERDALPRVTHRLRTAGDARASRPTGRSARACVAVLPFARPDDPEPQRRRGEGLAEDITTELGRFRELDVIAPASAAAYRLAAVPPGRIAGELGATHLVDGSVRADAERLRVTVRLVEAATGRQVWAQRYACAAAGVFEVGDDIVRCIAGTLASRFEDIRLEAVRRLEPEQWDAYDLAAQGWSVLKRGDRTSVEQARELFRRAIATETGFARAYSGLALALWAEWACFYWNPSMFVQQEGVELARKAVQLDARDHRAHCILGVSLLYAGDYGAARRHLCRALDLNPCDADVLAHVSFGLSLVGEHRLAVEIGHRALRLQPHHADWHAGMVGVALFGARLHEEAIETMAPAPEGFCSEPAFIAAACAHLGRAEEASAYRQTVYRHYRNRLARGEFAAGTTCVAWLLGIDPFQRPEDVEHYAEGLRRAGFE
jgi:DNA-binding SARP family transcriptional activator